MINITIFEISKGDQDGLGGRRKQELRDSCEILGIKSEDIYIYQCVYMPIFFNYIFQ